MYAIHRLKKTVHMYLERAFINEDANDLMQEHADIGSPMEIGGFLLGRPCIHKDSYYVWITGIVEGDCISSKTHVTIKETTYDRIWDELEHKRLIIVGWYHTHPGFGIFLSGTDVRTCKTYYNNPYQIAVVIDPINNDQAMFGWTDKSCTTLGLINASIYSGHDPISQKNLSNRMNTIPLRI